MSIPIQPNSIKVYQDEALERLQQLGQAGINVDTEVAMEKEASMEKKAGFSKEEQAQYWKNYFESANVMMDYEDWFSVLFG